MIEREIKLALKDIKWLHKRIDILGDRIYALGQKIVMLQGMLNIKNTQKNENGTTLK